MKLINHCMWCQFSRLSTLMKISHSLSLQCFNYVRVPRDFWKTPHDNAAADNTNNSKYDRKNVGNKNLDLVLLLMRFIYCICRFTQRRSCCAPTHFPLCTTSCILIKLLDRPQHFKKTKRTFQTWFWANTDHLCSTFWAKVEKAKSIKEIFLVRLKQPTHKRIGWSSAGPIWILFWR